MADITVYTTTQAVRAALGVTTSEVPDVFLVDQNLDAALILDLDAWLPDRSAVTGAQASALKLYSMWFVAAYLAEMTLAFPQKISDGKADMRRFTELDLEAIAETAKANRDKFKGLLLPDESEDASYGYVAAVAASPAYDPITNEEV